MTELERNIQARIMMAVSRVPGALIWRNHVGQGWLGEYGGKLDGQDAIILKHARKTTFGLCPDSSDLIGIYRGRFTALEVKRPGKKPTDGQQHFIDTIIDHDGIAGVVRSVEDARQLLGVDCG